MLIAQKNRRSESRHNQVIIEFFRKRAEFNRQSGGRYCQKAMADCQSGLSSDGGKWWPTTIFAPTKRRNGLRLGVGSRFR